MPVTSALRKLARVGAKLTAAALTLFPISRLAMPGTAFDSKARVGTRRRIAASIAGPEAYPPTPTTTCGCQRRKRTMQLQETARQCDQGFKLGGETDAVELADIDEFKRIAGLRYQAGFHSPGGAEETDFRRVSRLERIGDGKRRNDVAPCAAAGNHDPHAISRSPG